MKQATIDNALDGLNLLHVLLTDRVKEMEGVKGHLQSVHVMQYYIGYVDNAADKITGNNYKHAIAILQELSKLLDDRIADLHEIKGVQHYRHCYVYYRSLVYDAWFTMRNELEREKKQ